MLLPHACPQACTGCTYIAVHSNSFACGSNLMNLPWIDEYFEDPVHVIEVHADVDAACSPLMFCYLAGCVDDFFVVVKAVFANGVAPVDWIPTH